LDPSSTSTWRLWLTASAVGEPNTVMAETDGQKPITPTGDFRGQQALAVGKDDVDLDVFFLRPGNLTLRTQEKTRMSGSSFHQRATPSTQIGLIADLPAGHGAAVVLYP